MTSKDESIFNPLLPPRYARWRGDQIGNSAGLTAITIKFSLLIRTRV